MIFADKAAVKELVRHKSKAFMDRQLTGPCLPYKEVSILIRSQAVQLENR